MRWIRLVTLAALALGLSTPVARAAVIAPGSTSTVTALGQSFELDSVHDGNFVLFTDVYTFDLPAAVLATNDGRAKIDIFLRENLDGSVVPVAGELINGPGLVYTPVPLPFDGGGFTNRFVLSIVNPGIYTITLRGLTGADVGSGYTGSISFVTPLPVPVFVLGLALAAIVSIRKLGV